MGLYTSIHNIFDTISYICQHGWKEYREARRKYDNHMRLQGYGDGKFDQKKYIKDLKSLRKRNK